MTLGSSDPGKLLSPQAEKETVVPSEDESVTPTPKKRPKKKRVRKPRPSIGWREWVALPELGIEAVKAKVDTGAATSSLHVTDLQARHTEDGVWLDFVVHPVQRQGTPALATGAWLVDERPVRDSGGRSELRPVIRTRLEVGERSFDIEITLTRRDNMGFRMLLGRQAMRRRFVVDPGRSFLAQKRPE